MMKNFLAVFMFSLLPVVGMAQTTDVINYQAVVRDSNGSISKNAPITLRVSIISGSASGTVVYEETHDITTDDNGYFYTHIGNGSTLDNYSAIKWGSDIHFLKTEYDFNDGSTFLLAGLSELTSVAYANYANNYNETDPVFNNSVAKGISEADTANWNNYSTPIEVDPIFENSTAKGITEADTANWNYTADINTNKYINAFVGIRTTPDISPITIKGYDPNPSDNLPFAKLIQFNDEANAKSWDMELATYAEGVNFNINQTGVGTRLALRADGNVGIGTAFPSEILEIRSSGIDSPPLIHLGNLDNSHYLYFFAGRENDPNPFINWKEGDPLRLATTDNSGVFKEHMRISSNGNIGIGTTFPTNKLDVRGSTTDDGVIFNIGNSDDTHFLGLFGGRENDPNPFVSWHSGDPLSFGTFENQGVGGEFTEHIRISADGRLGIGAFNFPADIATPITIKGIDSQNLNMSDLIQFNDENNVRRWHFTLHGNTDFVINETGITQDVIHLKAGGNIGIGVQNPSERLSVNGIVESISGGIKFPDGTIQVSASTPFSGDMQNQNVSNVANPIDPQDAATKNYVDVLEARLNAMEGILIDNGLYTLKDYDGNIYPIIKIGNQYWMGVNLKTTKYSNGDEITDGSGIGDLTGGLDNKYWFYYEDNSTNLSTYGRLYTGYAVRDERNVCPLGWHVPLESDYEELVLSIGGVTGGGSKLNETGTIHWDAPNANSTDMVGFTSLPAGLRRSNGIFEHLGFANYYWEQANELGFQFRRYWGNDTFPDILRSNTYNPNFGMSVRCIKD